MMKKKNNKICRCITKHVFTCAVILLLILIGPILIIVDLTFLTEWINSLRMGDFYTYVTFTGIVSVWSIYGFITTLMRSVGGITVYMIGLSFITIVQFFIGFVHIMLLFTTYRPILMDSCLQRQPTRFFWWSLGYEDNEEMTKIYSACSAQWNSFATERLVSWAVYSLVSFICLYVIVKYQRFMTYQRNKAQGMITEASGDWSSDDEDYSYLVDEKKKGLSVQTVTYHNEEFPPTTPTENELSASMYQQRQKLFDEIAKRKRARKNLNRKSIASNPNRDSVLVVHPLDLAQDPEAYQPPPMPPAGEESWTRYDAAAAQLKEDEEAIDRQKRVDALSTERLEYEMYRTSEPSTRQNSIRSNLSEVVKSGASRRKRPADARWSACYSDTSNTLQPLTSSTSTNEEGEGYYDYQHEEDDPHQEDHMPPADDGEQQDHHDGYQRDHQLPEEPDKYEDIQHEDPWQEDENDSSATNSLLMKPAKEETI